MNLATDIALNEENLNRVIEAIRGLFESYAGQMNAAIRDNKDRKLTVNLSVCIAHNEPAPAIDVKIAFVPCKITDLMSLVCVDPAQKQFEFENADHGEPDAATEPEEPPHVVAGAPSDEPEPVTPKRGRKARAMAMEGGEA